MSFRKIRGQAKALNILRHALSTGRLAHAYLFVGAEGIGKRLTATTLAKALNCLAPPYEADCCDQCSSCRKIDSGNHSDLILIEPAGEVIKIDQIRELQTWLRFRPWEGRSRVCILEAAELMKAEAANAFLKTLEEPPPGTYFFLITARPYQLPSTIISRCQWVKFQALPKEEIAQILIEKYSLPQDKAIFWATLGEGSVSRALTFSDQLEFTRREQWLKILSKLPSKSFKEVTEFCEEIARQEQINELLGFWMIWVRDLLVYKVKAEKAQTSNYNLINHDLAELMAAEAPKYSFPDLDFLFNRVAQGQKSIEQKVNHQLALENLLLDIQKYFTKKSIGPYNLAGFNPGKK